MGPGIVISVINLKGGSGKTTTAANVAHVLHELGLSVLAVDADPQGSLFDWHESVGFPFSCVSLPSGKLHKDLLGIAGDRYQAVVIDTPPTEHGRQIAMSAALAATHVIVPVAPTNIEYRRLEGLRQLLEDATDLRPNESPPIVGVLLVRVRPAASATTHREKMVADGWPVLRSQVPLWERYAQSFGEPIRNANNTGYGDAVAQLLGLDA